MISSLAAKSGGPAEGIRNSIPALDALGCTNEVVCFDDGADQSLRSESFPIYSMGNAYGVWNWNAQLKSWLVNHLHQYDAVIVHGLWQYHCYALMQAVRKLKEIGTSDVPRVFVMPHGMLDPWFQTADTRYWKAWRNWFYWKAIEHRTISQADGLLFTCEQEMILARNTFRPYAPKQEHNVGYGIASPPEFSQVMRVAFQKVCPELGDRPYLLYLGRLHEKKGIDLLLNAYASVASQSNPRSPLPALVIAGPKDGTYANQLQLLWDNLNPASSIDTAPNRPVVYFPGMLQGDAKWGALYGCQAMVLPSHQENFGIAIVEAMACGKPVLISDKINIAREIQADGAGWIESDSLDGITKILNQWVAADDEPKSLMAQNAVRCYERHYQADNAAKRLLEVLRG